ncbi:MAG: LysR family transcriptional regulator [Allorhizobium sp.]
MNFKQLEVFKTIMETGSTIAAANALGLSQSAISRQLTSLEEQIGLELFLRDKGRLIPRPEAHLLIKEVEDISQSVGRLRNKIIDAKTGAFGDGLIRVAFPHSLATTMLPPIIASFSAEYPRVTIELLSGPYDAIERMVRGRIADLGFVRLPPEDGGFDVRPLIASGTTCVMPIGHPLAEKEFITVRDLARNDLILLGRQRINRNELEHELRRIVPSYRCRLEVHSVETACACAAEGLGVAIVPSLIARFFKSRAIEMRPFHPDKLADYGIITLPGAPLSWPGEALFKAIEQATAA